MSLKHFHAKPKKVVRFLKKNMLNGTSAEGLTASNAISRKNIFRRIFMQMRQILTLCTTTTCCDEGICDTVST